MNKVAFKCSHHPLVLPPHSGEYREKLFKSSPYIARVFRIIYLAFRGVCMCTCAHVCTSSMNAGMWYHACGVSEVSFFIALHFIPLSQNLSLNLELTYFARLAGQPAPEIGLSLLAALQLQAHVTMACFYVDVEDSNLLSPTSVFFSMW